MTSRGSRIDRIEGPATVLRGDDIDTDRIIPARFLKVVTFDGLGDHAFADDRAEMSARGDVHPFDAPAHQQARVLVVGANFGCGSSREHAPRAIAQTGVGAIVGRSFAEIFVNNSVQIGLPCVVVDAEGHQQIQAAAEAGARVSVDLDRRRVAATARGTSVEWPLEIADTAREAFLSGAWDGTALLLERYDEVDAVNRRLPYPSGF